MPGALRLQPEPAGGQHSQEVSAGKQKDRALNCSNPVHDAVRPRRYLVKRFPARESITEHLPTRTLRLNVRGAETFVLAVVPFNQVTIHFRSWRKAGEIRSPL